MKTRKRMLAIFVMFCLVGVGIFSSSVTVQAKKITSMRQVEKLALKKVKNGVITEVSKDYEKGMLVYEIELRKGTKEYDLTYRASDGKLISYGWDELKVDRRSKKKVMSQSKVKKLAKKKVKGAKITELKRKRDNGVIVYQIKLKKGNTKYKLEYHARTGKLLEYEWEMIFKPSKKAPTYIGHEKAKKIALKKVPGAAVLKVEFDIDDGVPVYEVELIRKSYEYEIEIHAKTGKILDFEKKYLDYDDYDDDYDDWE